MGFVLFVSILVITVYVYNHFTKYKNYWKNQNVPGPKPTFFVGNMKDLFLRRRSAGEIFKEIYEKYPNEKFIGVFRMRTPVLLIKDPDIIKNILIRDFDAFVERGGEFDNNDLGTNLFHANGETWRALRQHISPLFTHAKLKNMIHLTKKPANMLADLIDQLIRTQSQQDAHGLAKKFTQANIVTCAFGLEVDSFDTQEDIIQLIEKRTLCSSYSNELDMMYPGILKKIGGSLYPTEVKEYFFRLTKFLIAQKNGEPSNRKNLIDILVALKKAKQIGPRKENDMEMKIEMTDALLAAQLFIVYIGGYQTSAATISYMLYRLALNPDIQDKVTAEIDEVVARYEGEFTLEAISELKYMDQGLHETTRLHSAVDNVKREARMDYKIPDTNITLKKGQTVIIPLNVLHNDPAHFPRPDLFDPERFSSENKLARRFCSFMPFGEGPRQCIGYRFASLQSKYCMATLLSKFRVEPSKDTPKIIRIQPARLVQVPKGGIHLNWIRRRPGHEN